MKTNLVPETYNDVVALYVRELRKRWFVTQRALADYLHISQSHLSRIESGTKVLEEDALDRFIAFSAQTREQFFDEIDRRVKKAGIHP